MSFKAGYDYDIIIVGGGAAGLTAAKFARGLGYSVALVERQKLGGECTWTGCIPSKTIIDVAHRIRGIKYGKKLGINATLEINSGQILEHVRSTIKEIYEESTPEKLNAVGINVLHESTTFIDNHTIAVSDTLLRAKKFIIATGSSPYIPNIQGLTPSCYLTNQTIFNLTTLPESMIILGGGAIGTELACALQQLDVRVTVLEKNNHILANEDPELVDIVNHNMIQDGIAIRTNVDVTAIAETETSISVSYADQHGKTETVCAQTLLIATGRIPNIQGLSLENAGVDYTANGIRVNQYLQTSAKNIYACGDVVGPYRFSHMAWYQAVVATRNALIPLSQQKVDYSQRIWATFCTPELATMGLTEQEALKQYGTTIKIYTKSYNAIDRAHTDNATHGLLKVICDKRGYILGATIVGARAADIIHELHLAKSQKIRFHTLHTVIHAYPTYAEIIWHLSKQAYVERLQKNRLVQLAKKIMLFFR